MANQSPIPRRRERPRILPAAFVLVLAVALGGSSCGDESNGPSGTVPGGTVSGRYTMQIRPSASCPFRGPFTFPMTAATYAAVGSRQGVQVVLDGGTPASLEGELLYVSNTMRGGLGAPGSGVLSNEGTRFWIRMVATGAVTHTGNEPGEVTAGTGIGYMAIGASQNDEGGLGVCSATDHAFTLLPR